MRHVGRATAVVALAVAAPAYGQAQDDAEAQDLLVSDPVVVTASRGTQVLEEIPVPSL